MLILQEVYTTMDKTDVKRRIMIVTSTRADWGLLSPVARRLCDRKDVELLTVATNMHLDRVRGMTLNEIEADGITVDRTVAMTPDSTTPAALTHALALCLDSFASVFEDLKPDIMLILGDRYEMLAAASAATLFSVPIAHISGGEITEGAFDDNIRHALTKLSSLHFPTTDAHRRRILAMGENPDAVINAGALGVYNIMHEPRMSTGELEKSLGFKFSKPTLLVTFHPATADPTDPAIRFSALLNALDRFPEAKVIITYPNNDPRSETLIPMIENYAKKNIGRVLAIPSLGRHRYLSILKIVDAVVGNSSSGIVEVPSAGIPTVDVGIRQRGRTASGSVIHCGDSTEEIHRAIMTALSDSFRQVAQKAVNPYARPDTPDIIARTVATYPIEMLIPKKFNDIIPLT